MQGGHEYDWKKPMSYSGRNLPDTVNGSHQILRDDGLVEPEACQQDSPQFINVGSPFSLERSRIEKVL